MTLRKRISLCDIADDEGSDSGGQSSYIESEDEEPDQHLLTAPSIGDVAIVKEQPVPVRLARELLWSSFHYHSFLFSLSLSIVSIIAFRDEQIPRLYIWDPKGLLCNLYSTMTLLCCIFLYISICLHCTSNLCKVTHLVHIPLFFGLPRITTSNYLQKPQVHATFRDDSMNFEYIWICSLDFHHPPLNNSRALRIFELPCKDYLTFNHLSSYGNLVVKSMLTTSKIYRGIINMV